MVISRLYNIVRKNVNDMNMAIDIKLFFHRLAVFLGLFCMLAAWCPATAKAAGRVSGLRIGQGIGSVRIVFDADAEFDYNVFLLNYPKRLVVDTKNVYIGKALEKTRDKNNLVSRVRVGDIRDGKTRVVFDLLKPVVVKRVFMLPPQSTFKWRLAIDVSVASEREFVSKTGINFALGDKSLSASGSVQAGDDAGKAKAREANRKKIIVIDAGHGGHDPGAIGYSGVHEKNITLAMAKELKRQLDRKGTYKVYLTRSTDIFIPLRRRVEIARDYKADLFMSVHADSALNRRATGLSVYTLSETASDKEAAALAERENKADVISGLNLYEQSKEVSDVLISLAQRETRNRSSEFAKCLVDEMRKSVKLINDTHRFAGFAVLKAPDVPSVLLEMGYLSNKNEERLLRQESYRRKLAASAVRAIDCYFEDMKHKSLF